MSSQGAGPDQSPSIVLFGAGFVGQAVRDALADLGPVTVLDIPTHPVLADRNDDARRLVESILADVSATAVVNCSGLLRGTDTEVDAANHLWPEWLVGVLMGSGVRFVHLGSASEYGDPGSAEPITEERPANPSGLYGETKWAGSSTVLAAREAGLDAVVLRGFNLVAPTISPVSPLYQFRSDVQSLRGSGGVIEMWWPDTIRDFIMLSDLADVVARLAVLESVPAIVNGCSGVGLRFGDIVEELARACDKDVTIRSLDRPGIEAVVGDPTLLAEVTGIEPRMSLELLVSSICSPGQVVA